MGGKADKKQFNLPNSILIKQGFYCSSSLLNVGEGTGLADTFILAYAPVGVDFSIVDYRFVEALKKQ